MCEPSYQDLNETNLKIAEKGKVKVRIIGGEAMGIKSQIFCKTPCL